MLNLTPFLPSALVLAVALAGPVAAAPPPPPAGREGEIVNVSTADRRVNAAKAKARRTLPDFLAVLAAPPPGTQGITFKYPLGGWEHIWVEEVTRRGDRLSGRLANVPDQPGFRQGQRVTVPLAEVSDWGYRDARGVMQGHFTTRALLPLVAPDQAREIRESFGWPAPRARASAPARPRTGPGTGAGAGASAAPP